jgi:hypothetical protein
MMKDLDQDTRLLIETLRHCFPTPPRRGFASWSVPPLNVLDCVLSLNRRYETFCKPRVRQFANQHPEVDTLTRLLHLINKYPTPLEFSIRELDYRDEGRAATLVGVLTYLLQAQKAFKGSSETSRLRQWASKAKPNTVHLRCTSVGQTIGLCRLPTRTKLADHRMRWSAPQSEQY